TEHGVTRVSDHQIEQRRSDQRAASDVPNESSQSHPIASSAGLASRVSVIIPLHRDGDGFRRCLGGCLTLAYPSFEVIVVSDSAVALPASVRPVLSGAVRNTGPGEKRDLGMSVASGGYVAV